MSLRVVLFDLFGTVVHFAPRGPRVEGASSGWRAAMGWLRTAAEHDLPHIPFDDLLAALLQVSDDLVRQRPPEYLEVPSRERFRRALLRFDVDAATAATVAERLSLAHMAYLASTTHLPAGHGAVLQTLAARYRLGLISNFDHGPTARRVLADHGLDRRFDAVVISDGFGRRKPHPAIFEAALRDLGVPAAQAVYVGDSVADDLVGATNAQLAMVWINPKGEALPPDAPRPRAVIRGLDELPAVLAQW